MLSLLHYQDLLYSLDSYNTQYKTTKKSHSKYYAGGTQDRQSAT